MKSVIGGIRLASGKHVLGMNKTRHIFGTAKVGDRGQIVIPKEARTLFSIQPGDTLLLLADEKRGLAIPEKGSFASLFQQVFRENPQVEP